MKIDANPIAGERVKPAAGKPSASKREKAGATASRTDTVDLSSTAASRTADEPVGSIDDALALAGGLAPLPSGAEDVHTAPTADHTWDLIRD